MSSNFTSPWEYVNENNTWQYKVHVAILVTNCTVLLVTFLVGIAANLFVIYAVYHQKSLQTSTNALLVNLAVIDLLRCATDCPLLLIVVLNENKARDLGDLLCDSQVISFSLSCCVQLFTLASISAERHQAVANPFKTAERRKRVKVWIPLTWVVAVVVSVLCVMFIKDSSVYVRCKALHWDTLKTYGSFGRYVLLPVWSVCLALIVGFYSHILILVKAHNRKIFDKGVSYSTYKNVPKDKNKVEAKVETKVAIATETAAPKEIHDTQLMHKESEQAPGTKSSNGDPDDQKTLSTDTKTMDAKTEHPLERPSRKSVILVSELHHNTTELVDLENSVSEDAEKPTSEEVPSAANNQQPASKLHKPTTELADPRNDEENPGEPPKDDKKPNSDQVPPKADGAQTASVGQTMEVMGEVCMMPSFANKEKGSKKKESRLAKRSGYIIITFLVFWMPLIGTVVLNSFINRNHIWEEVEVLVVSISCMTSLTNPIIYTAVNPQFRAEFYNLKKRCKALCLKS